MPQRPLIASLAIVCLGLGASCFNEAKAPSIVPTRTLALPVDVASPGVVGPVTVAFSSSSPVGVVFDRPMRSGAAAVHAIGGGGAPAGEWRWVGHSALVFSPSSRLRFATEYEVTVPAGAQAIDGSVLAAAYLFRFATERPALVSLAPREGQIPLQPAFDVRFSHAVSPEEAERSLRLWVGDSKERRAVPLRARRADGGTDATHLVLAPVAALPPGSSVEVVLDESLHGLEGPLPSGRLERFEMRTYGPLAVVSARRTASRVRSRCASSGAELELTNPVTVRELRAHVHFEPSAPIAWNREDDDALTKVDLRAPIEPARKYELVVTPGMKDVYGQVLSKTMSRMLEASSEPLLHIGEEEVFAVGAGHAVGVEAANLNAYDLLALPLNEPSLARYFAEATPEAPDPLAEASRLFPQAKVQAVRRAAPLGPPETRSVSLDVLLAAERGRGAALVVAETEGPTRAGTQLGAVRVVTQTDLRMTARIGLRGGVVWVHRLSNGRPVPGAVVVVRDPTGVEVASAQADESGMAILPADARALVNEGGSVDPRSLLVARAGDDWTFRPVADDLEGACREPVLGVAGITGALLTDRESYELGDTIHVKTLFREERRRGEGAPAGRPIRLTATGPRGNLVATTEGRLDSYGGFGADVEIPATERSGPWALRAEVLLDAEHGAGAATATVAIIAPSRFDLDDRAQARRSVPPASIAPASSSQTAPTSSGHLALASDKDAYQVGQTATIRFESPFRQADAFVTVEGTSTTHGERVHVVGAAAVLRVPITEDMSHGAHVAVLLSKTPAVTGSPDDGSTLALGQLGLRVEGASRRLRVVISPATKNPAPGGPLEADVAVTDPAGVPVRASVVLAAVDSTSRVPRPDVLQVFDAPPPPSSYWIESRADMGRTLLPSRRPAPVPATAGAELATRGAAERAARTAFFDGSLLTDVTGRAHVRFSVPEGTTTLQLYAVAATEDSRFGSGEASVDTSPTLGVELDGPAVVRAGDHFEVRATLSSRGPTARSVVVSIAAMGVDVGPNIRQEVTVPAGARLDTRWPVRATVVGNSEVVFSARAGDQVTEATFARRVEDPSEVQSAVFYGEASDAAADHIGDWANVRPDDGALDLKVSVTALVGLDDGIEQILRYRYEDTEQHATRLVALSALPDLVKDFGVVLPSDAGGLADREIAALLAAQQPDGSFASWPGSSEARDGATWRSVYALWALNAATMHGHRVAEDATNRAVAFVKQSLKTMDRSPRETAEAAFAVDVLADMGLGDGEKMLALYRAKDHEPVFVRALLAHAMTVQQMDDSKVEDLLGDLDSHLRTTADGSVVAGEERGGEEYGPLLDSGARATAMVLRAVVARAKARAPNVFRKIRPSDLAARVARGLLSMRRGGAWRTPEETIWALRSLEDYRAAHVLNHPDVDALFYVNGVELLKLPMHDRKEWQVAATFGMRKVLGAAVPGGTLGFRVNGDASVHYEARVRFADSRLGAEAVDRGLAVDKRFSPVRAGVSPDAGPGVVRRGDEVSVDLLVATAVPRDHVTVDDPLPGGLVALGEGGASGGPVVGTASHVEVKDGRVVLHVDHLLPGMTTFHYTARAGAAGRYVVPATVATCRYAPEVFGRTRVGEIEVKE